MSLLNVTFIFCFTLGIGKWAHKACLYFIIILMQLVVALRDIHELVGSRVRSGNSLISYHTWMCIEEWWLFIDVVLWRNALREHARVFFVKGEAMNLIRGVILDLLVATAIVAFGEGKQTQAIQKCSTLTILFTQSYSIRVLQQNRGSRKGASFETS